MVKLKLIHHGRKTKLLLLILLSIILSLSFRSIYQHLTEVPKLFTRINLHSDSGEPSECSKKGLVELGPGPAYYDTRQGLHMIAVLLYGPSDYQDPLTCHFPRQRYPTIAVNGILDNINLFAQNENCWSYFLLCGVPVELRGSEIREIHIKPYHWLPEVTLPVRSIVQRTYTKHYLTICVTALFDFEDWQKLVIFIEYHRLIGVEHFIFYRESVKSKTVDQLLWYYVQMGLLEIVEWPGSWSASIVGDTYHGQSLALNDCVMRSVGITRFLALIDVDEFIGQTHQSIRPHFLRILLESLDENYESSAGFMLKSAPVYNQESTNPSPESTKLATITESMHQMAIFDKFELNEIFDIGDRSKVIVRPERVVKMGVHEIIMTTYVKTHFWDNSETQILDPLTQSVLFHLQSRQEIDWTVNYEDQLNELNQSRMKGPGTNLTVFRRIYPAIQHSVLMVLSLSQIDKANIAEDQADA